jgi:hypothetical protein
MRPLYLYKILLFENVQTFSDFQLFLSCLFSSTYGVLYGVQKNRHNVLNVLGECDYYSQYADPIELSQIRPGLVYAGDRKNGKWIIQGVCLDYEYDADHPDQSD